MIIFFQPSTRAEDLARSHDEMAALEGVEDVVVVDQQATYERFVELFAENESLVANVKPEVLPPSLQIEATAVGPIDAIEAKARSLDGVRNVVRADAWAEQATAAGLSKAEIDDSCGAPLEPIN